MLQKVISISNVGRFRNSASQPNPTFGRQTLVFAPNGYGKTTLCAILRAMERGEPDYVLSRKTLGQEAAPKVSVLWNGAQRAFGDSGWPGPEPKLSIFDGTFVAENIHSGDVVDVANRRNLYRVIVGRGGTGLAAKEAELAEAIRINQTILGPAEKAVEAISGGISPKAFDELPSVDDLDQQLEAQRRKLATQAAADAIARRAFLEEVPAPAWLDGVDIALRATLDGVGAEVEERVRAHLAAHNMEAEGEAWVARGTRFAAGDDCPYCGRDGIGEVDLVLSYRTLFSAAYNNLKSAIALNLDAVDAMFGPEATNTMRLVQTRNEGACEFWGPHCDVADLDFLALAPAIERMTSTHERLQSLLNKKIAAPLDNFDGDRELDSIRCAFDDLCADIARYNTAVASTNARIREKKSATASADLASVQGEIERLLRIQRRHSADGLERCRIWREAAAEKVRLNGEKSQTRKALEDHCDLVVQPYEKRINEFLKLFNAGFTISRVGHAYPGGVATSSYALIINNVEVALGDAKTPSHEPSFKTTLSAGDRTTLALAFFLAHLERESDLAERVVVFDDPFNSQDSYRRRQTIFEIAAVAKKGAQIIVLSHDPLFLKQVWVRCEPDKRVAVQLFYHASTGSKIMPFDLDDACQGRAANELDDLLAFRNQGTGNPRDVIKKLRVVLETHMRSAFSGSFLANDNLGEIIRKVREGGEGHPAASCLRDLDRINDYTAEYHHGEDAGGEAEPVLDREELTGFVDQTLTIANALPG